MPRKPSGPPSGERDRLTTRGVQSPSASKRTTPRVTPTMSPRLLTMPSVVSRSIARSGLGTGVRRALPRGSASSGGLPATGR
jgi:hypothetical protein